MLSLLSSLDEGGEDDEDGDDSKSQYGLSVRNASFSDFQPLVAAFMGLKIDGFLCMSLVKEMDCKEFLAVLSIKINNLHLVAGKDEDFHSLLRFFSKRVYKLSCPETENNKDKALSSEFGHESKFQIVGIDCGLRATKSSPDSFGMFIQGADFFSCERTVPGGSKLTDMRKVYSSGNPFLHDTLMAFGLFGDIFKIYEADEACNGDDYGFARHILPIFQNDKAFSVSEKDGKKFFLKVLDVLFDKPTLVGDYVEGNISLLFIVHKQCSKGSVFSLAARMKGSMLWKPSFSHLKGTITLRQGSYLLTDDKIALQSGSYVLRSKDSIFLELKRTLDEMGGNSMDKMIKQAFMVKHRSHDENRSFKEFSVSKSHLWERMDYEDEGIVNFISFLNKALCKGAFLLNNMISVMHGFHERKNATKVVDGESISAREDDCSGLHCGGWNVGLPQGEGSSKKEDFTHGPMVNDRSMTVGQRPVSFPLRSLKARGVYALRIKVFPRAPCSLFPQKVEKAEKLMQSFLDDRMLFASSMLGDLGVKYTLPCNHVSQKQQRFFFAFGIADGKGLIRAHMSQPMTNIIFPSTEDVCTFSAIAVKG